MHFCGHLFDKIYTKQTDIHWLASFPRQSG